MTTGPPSNEKSSPKGAASLMGIFDPPPTSRSTGSGNAKAQPPSQQSLSKQEESTTLPPGPGPGPTPKTPAATNRSPSASDLMSMFDPPSSPSKSSPQKISDNAVARESVPLPPPYALNANERQSTIRQNNLSDAEQDMLTERTSLLQSIFDPAANDDSANTPISTENQSNKLQNLHSQANSNYYSTSLLRQLPLTVTDQDDETPKKSCRLQPEEVSYSYAAVKIPDESAAKSDSPPPTTTTTKQSWKSFCGEHFQPSTFAGAGMFLLYHVVFCLANGSAIVRPHATQPVLGQMAKLTTVGILMAGPLYIWRLGQDVPALYPSGDLFLAPFLASAAKIVDEIMEEDGLNEEGSNSNEVFLASFAVLAAIGMLSAGILLELAATFKLANLGTFLPYSVLCGFFSAVGVLLWALSFSVDTNGKTWQDVLFSGDISLIYQSILHHLPSFTVGIMMNLLGPKHPFYVILLIFLTLIGFYTTMWITGTSLEEAQEQHWFWSQNELSIPVLHKDNGSFLASWVPPIPFGHWGAMLQGQVHWRAVRSGLKDMFLLALLYLLRSSIHASAMKKNINNLVCKKRNKTDADAEINTTYRQMPSSPISVYPSRTTSDSRRSWFARLAMDAIEEKVRLVNEGLQGHNTSGGRQSIRPTSPPETNTGPLSEVVVPIHENKATTAYQYTEVRPKPCHRSLKDLFVEYGYALILVAFSGGFGVCPTVATSNTMYAIGAGGRAPQYGSCLLLVIFYITDFSLVRYIPKACFSSLLVLGAVDTFVVWFFLSYRKTQDLLEWLVVPFIVAFSLVVGFLNAVFLGVGISTFVFVASFFRVGIVKFNATGLEIRSTIERSFTVSHWLDTHGDYIQVLVLQNYLFFGNASSVQTYISTMFEDVEEDSTLPMLDLPPKPKVLILDMSLISGMDTSTLDIFAEIKDLCKNNNCKLFLCGLSARAKKGLALTGVKPGTGSKDLRLVRFFADLDVALGKAEDFISLDLQEKEKIDFARRTFSDLTGSGFQRALKYIDEQHGQEFSKNLLDLEPYTQLIELHAGDCLFACDGGTIEESDRGLFFIESGMLKIERDAMATLTRGRTVGNTTRNRSFGTLNNLHARSGTIGRQCAALKAKPREPMHASDQVGYVEPSKALRA